jgi:tRNA(fMet)-specific endonuclease VapC
MPDASLLRWLQAHADAIATASVVWHELLFGCYRLSPSRRRSAIESYLLDVVEPSVPILPYSAEAAQWHAQERARLSALGRTPPFVDGQVAAIAAVNDLVLVSANLADYEHFQGIEVVSWRG